MSPQGKDLWKFPTHGPIVSSALIDTNGTIYFGSHDGVLYALDRAGKKLWEFSAGAPILSSPAVNSSGSVYVTSVDGFLHAVEPGGKEV